MLETITNFVEKYPQTSESSRINYIICGGSAIRLNQEYYQKKTGKTLDNIRPITDLDIVNLSKNSYLTHSTQPNNIFQTGTEMTVDELIQNSLCLRVDSSNIWFGNRELITVLKSTMTPRDKDYFDVLRLDEMGLNKKKLEEIYKKCKKIPRDTKFYSDSLVKFIGMENSQDGCKLFQTLPSYANLHSKFGDDGRVRAEKIMRSYVIETEKTPYEISCDLSNIALVLGYVKSNINFQIRVMKTLLEKSKSENYTNFDNYIHYKILPVLQFAKNDEERIAFLEKMVYKKRRN